MTTIGYVFVLLGLIVTRAVYKGRITTVGSDISDAFQALVSGDTDAFAAILNRTGTGATADTAVLAQGIGGTLANVFVGQTDVLNAAIALGSTAKGYRLGAIGPTYYDCSGLIWQACRKAGVYSGPRFVTSTIGHLKSFTRVDTPVIGDIVVWPVHHMGVMSGPNKLYSAESLKSGIGYSSISGISSLRGYGQPVYMRPTALIKVSGDIPQSSGHTS
jgi:cell wall-associated NlpC family hydrolase